MWLESQSQPIINSPPMSQRAYKSKKRPAKAARATMRPYKKKTTIFSLNRSVMSMGRDVDKRVFPCTMASTADIAWNPSIGLSYAGNNSVNVVWGCMQSGPIVSFGGGAWVAFPTFQNYTSFAAVFQEYRILKFELEWYYSNQLPTTVPGTLSSSSNPICYSVEDREDALGLTSEAAVTQYPSMKVNQMGAPGTPNGKNYFCINKPSVFVAVDNDASLLGTIVASKVDKSPWLALGTNGGSAAAAPIPHGYIKQVYDGQGNATNAVMGTLTYIVRAYFEFRGID